MQSTHRRFNTAAIGLILLIGTIALINLAINIRAMVFLRSAFDSNTSWALDFQRITQWMIAKAFLSIDLNNPKLTAIAFFKLTFQCVSLNNQIVLWLSLTEIGLVNTVRNLRKISTLRKIISVSFGLVIVVTLAVVRTENWYKTLTKVLYVRNYDSHKINGAACLAYRFGYNAVVNNISNRLLNEASFSD
ncbi:MAG: hypothetical protein AAGI69_18890 [Cyanobacteria bacterium P01_H01_bin.21]